MYIQGQGPKDPDRGVGVQQINGECSTVAVRVQKHLDLGSIPSLA